MGRELLSPNASVAPPQPYSAGPAQDSSAPMSMEPEYDDRCRALNTRSMAAIRDFLRTADTEVQGFDDWRAGGGWGDGLGDSIPTLQTLSSAARNLENTAFGCEGQDDVGVAATDPLVREALSGGVEDAPGITDGDIALINEWMAYDGGRLGALASYFCLAPPTIQHSYSLSTTFEVSGGVGLGAGGKVAIPGVGEAALGCYPMATLRGGVVHFGYSNNLGLSWEAGYGYGTVELGAECAFRLSLGPAVRSSMGSDSLCSGSATSRSWYGPGDFSGATASASGGVDGGVGVTAEVGLSGIAIAPNSGKPTLGFDTTGACLSAGLAMQAGIGVSGGGGYQHQVGDVTVDNQAASSVAGADGGLGACTPDEAYEPELGPLRTLLTRHFYFDTGSDDPRGGDRATDNLSAVRDITEALSDAEQTPAAVQFVITGHASPLWRGARDPHEAVEENLELAHDRAESTMGMVGEAYARFGGDWPAYTPQLDGVCVDNQATQQGSTRNMGSSEGLAETGDPTNDSARYRRATVVVNMQSYRMNRNTVPMP